MKLNPEPDLGTDYSDTITQVEVTLEAYDDGAGNEDILENLPIYVDATTSDGPLSDNDQLWIVDDFGVGPSFSTTSDTPGPGCETCQQQALAESQALVDAKDGDLLITTTDMSNDNSWDEYLPQYSTGAIRDAVASVDTRFAQSGSTPESIEVELYLGNTLVGTTYYDASGVDYGDTFRIAQPLDVSALAAGSYSWSMNITEVYSAGSQTYFAGGTVLVEGESNALLSPGWSIPGNDRLTVSGTGALWQAGPNEMYWFTDVAGDYIGSSGDQSASTLVENIDGSFTLTSRWGETSTFNAAGLLVEKRDRDGNPTTFTYTDADSDSDNDDILEVETYDGRTLTYAYDTGRMVGVTDFEGREIAFGFDLDDQLASITYPDPDDTGPLDALVSEYTYVTSSSFIETADDGGVLTEFTYSFSGAVATVERSDRELQEFDDLVSQAMIDPGSGLGVALDPAPLTLVEGLVTTQDDAEGNTTTYVLGPYGSPVKMIDALGNETIYERDGRGRVTLQIDPDPDGVGSEPAPETAFVYDEFNNLLEMTLPDSSVRTWEYDPVWNIPTSYTDERGLLTLYDVNVTTGLVDSIRQVVGENDLTSLEEDDVVWEFTYTAAPSDPADPPEGLVETETDPLGNVTVYVRNARGDVTSVTYADGTADEATANFYYNADGTLDYQTDELGRRTDFGYDLLGRLVLKTLPDPDGGGPLPRPEIAYEYDSQNRLILEKDPLGRETTYEHDKRGRITQIERPDHDADSKLTVTTVVFDGLTRTVTDPLDRDTIYETDKLGRQTKVTLPQVPDWTTAVDEIQIIDFDSGTEGTFKLNGNSTYGVIDLADTSDFQAVLDDIWGAGNTSVKVTATEATVTFRGDQAATNVAQMTISDITGTKGATPAVSTDTAGVAPTLLNPTLETAYDALGRVVSEKDAAGNETTYEYTNFGHSVKITLPDPDGAGYVYSSPVIYREYDESWNLVSEKDAEGGETKYGYNVLNQLVSITGADPDGGGPLAAPVTNMVYDLAGNQRFVIDPLGNVTEKQYDNRNRLVKVIAADPDGSGPQSAPETNYTYDDASQLTKVTDALGRETAYEFDGLSRTTKITLPDPDGAGMTYTSPEILYGYDAAGRKTKETDELLNVTEYAYDDLDNLIQITGADPDGKGAQTSPVSKSEYDAANQLLNSTDARGNVTTYTHDNWGRQTSITGEDPDSGGPLTAPVTKFTYDLNSNVLSTLDPLKHLSTTVYDALNRVTISRDALGGETEFTYDDNGNVLTLTDPVENVTTWVYDALNRASEERNHLYDSRYFVYDAASNLIQKTDRNERVTVYEHDNLHRLVAEEWWGGTRPSIGVTTSTEGTATDEVQRVGFYDGTPFVSGTFTLTFDSQTTGNIAWDADAATVRAALEALSNIADGDVEVFKSQEYSTSQEWQITFVGALRGSDVTQITIDAAAVDNGVGPPTETETTDATGSSTDEVQVVTLSDATGGTFTLSFGGAPTDPLDWDASTGDVDSALEALSGAGTVSVSGSAGGPYTITFTGDYGGQDIAPLLYRANDLTNGDLLRSIEYTFNAGGELLEVSDPDATYEYVYDGLGRVTNFVQNLAGFSPEIEFVSQYNTASRREHLQTILDGDEDFQNSYTYDNLHRLSLMIQESGSDNVVAPKRFEFTYNDLSQFERIDRYASTDQSEFVASSHYSYDDLNRLQKLVHSETTTAPTSGWGSDPLAGYEFEYDEASRIAAIDSMLDGLSEYEHDDTYQLLAADHASMTDEAYEYDANGNRIMSGYDVDPNNQLYSDGTYNYTYDDEGNRETRTRIADGYVTRYEWDFRNRLTMVTEEDNSNNALQVTILIYDSFNQWISRSFDDDGNGSNPFTDTFFVYEAGQVVLEFDGTSDSDLTHRYAWSHVIDQSLADEGVSSLGSAGQTLWTLGDHLGTIRDLVTYNSTSNIATVANHRVWDSYGNLTDQSSAIYVSTIGHTGRMFDITTGFNYHLNRWHDATVGRWISEDPIVFGGGDTNLTRFVGNKILNHTDPTGQKLRFVGTMEDMILAYSILDYLAKLSPEIAKQIKEIEDSPIVVEIELVYHSKDVDFGAFGSSKIDIGDILVLPDKGPLSWASVFYHELIEQWEKRRKPPFIREYDECHVEALIAEEKVSGWKRVEPHDEVQHANYEQVTFSFVRVDPKTGAVKTALVMYKIWTKLDQNEGVVFDVQVREN